MRTIQFRAAQERSTGAMHHQKIEPAEKIAVDLLQRADAVQAGQRLGSSLDAEQNQIRALQAMARPGIGTTGG